MLKSVADICSLPSLEKPLVHRGGWGEGRHHGQLTGTGPHRRGQTGRAGVAAGVNQQTAPIQSQFANPESDLSPVVTTLLE
jgi:hypothetical protein